jgi:hypothetical protein
MRWIQEDPDKVMNVQKIWYGFVIVSVTLSMSRVLIDWLDPLVTSLVLFVTSLIMEVYSSYFISKDGLSARLLSRFWRSVAFAAAAALLLGFTGLRAIHFEWDQAVLAGLLGGVSVFVVGTIMSIVVEPLLGTVRLFQLPGKCHLCGYDLRGLSVTRCPECGTPFEPEKVSGCEHKIGEQKKGIN